MEKVDGDSGESDGVAAAGEPRGAASAGAPPEHLGVPEGVKVLSDGPPAPPGSVDVGPGPAAPDDRPALSPDEVIRREWALIHRIIASSVRDRAEVDDLTQEVFSRVLRHLSIGPDDPRVRAYLVQTARNLLRDRWRRYQSAPAIQGIEDAPEIAGGEPGPEEEVLAARASAEERAALVAALARLPAEMREILRLRLQEGRSASEVAAVTGKSPEAVRQVAHRALVRLRAEFLSVPGAGEGGEGVGAARAGRGGGEAEHAQAGSRSDRSAPGRRPGRR